MSLQCFLWDMGMKLISFPYFLRKYFIQSTMLIDYNNFQPKATCQTLKNTPLESIAETSDH